MSRVFYDSRKYYDAKRKLPKADGIHCITCGNKLNKPDKRRSYCSQACFSKWYTSCAVDNWDQLRSEVLKRDGKCLECGMKIETASPKLMFEVHHIKPIYEGGDEFDPLNCMTLCYDCHKEKHTIIGKQKRLNRSLEEFGIDPEV